MNFFRVLGELARFRIDFKVTILSRDYILTYKLPMDTVFKALGDPARRQILDALRREDGQTLSQLEDGFEMTRFGVMKHLNVLEEAGLVTTVKRGRFKHHYLNALPLQEAIDRWVEPLLMKPTARAMLDLKSHLEGTATSPDFETMTYIQASPTAVWTALTQADAQAAFNPFAQAARHDGDDLILIDHASAPLVTLTLAAGDPPSRLEQLFKPHWADHPPSRVVTTLRAEGRHTELKLSHFGAPARDPDTQTGWARTLAGLKTYLETGQPTRFSPPPLAAPDEPRRPPSD